MTNHAGLPSVSPYGSGSARSFRVLHEVWQAWASRRSGAGGASADSPNLSRAGRGDSPGAPCGRITCTCAWVFLGTCLRAACCRAVNGKTSHRLLRDHRRRRKAFLGRHLWARGYCVASSGNVTDETIAEYIRLQDTDPAADEQFKVSD